MSKFQLYRADVERRDKRYLWMQRSAAAAGAALLVWLATWSSGLDRAALSWLKSHAMSARAVALSHVREKQNLPPPLVLRKTQAPAFGGLRSSISKTSQRLVLTGTVLGGNPHEGQAFIGTDAHHPQTYSAGAILANGARLAEIFPRYVVLEKDNRQVRLYLGGGVDQNRRQTDDPLLIVGGHQTYRPAVANAKEEFTDFIRETPIYDGLVVRGFQVYPGKQASVFARIGLHPGDLITSVDGVPLTDPVEAVAILRELVAGASETAEVIRGGKAATVTLDGSLIAGELERQREAAGSAPGGPPST